jgi:putative Mn2+ efflux pump MntP
MSLIKIIGIGIGLSMDALSVSVVNGCAIKELKFKHAFRMSFFFGFFQAIMPVIGWAAGLAFLSYIQDFDHWIAFGLLTIVGLKMIWESRSLKQDYSSKNCIHLPTLLMLSIATSIDALAVGLSFSILKVQIILPVVIIGAITFILCLVGVYIGNRVGHFFENKLELIGGLILIGIGIKILIEHLVCR